MILAHGTGAARYDELVVVAVLLVVLLLAVLQGRWTARHRAERPHDNHVGDLDRGSSRPGP